LVTSQDGNFSAVYNRYSTSIYRFCLRMLNREEDAKDIVQELFLKFLESPVSLDGDTRAKSWLFKSARNRCLNAIRDRRKMKAIGEEEPAATGTREFDDSAAVVARLLEEMPLEYREVLVLREWSELSYEEIAESLDTTVSSVKSKIFKARRKAREIYEKLYGEK
jgi:RNA polymerase sigma factor (sigma-70 family)